MSWDVIVFDTRGVKPPPVEHFSEQDYAPLGPAAAVRQVISESLPGVQWTDPTWGAYEGEGFSIEFNLGDEDPVGSMMLHVRGTGRAIAAIITLARPLGWSVLDGSTGLFLDFDQPDEAGWSGHQAFVERVRDGS